jgi:hypothetical protein
MSASPKAQTETAAIHEKSAAQKLGIMRVVPKIHPIQ